MGRFHGKPSDFARLGTTKAFGLWFFSLVFLIYLLGSCFGAVWGAEAFCFGGSTVFFSGTIYLTRSAS